jgi:hypothetical protein
MARIAGPLLHAGHSALTGDAPNGQRFRVNPMRLPEQARLGDFWTPQRGLIAIGRAFFETGARAAV